MEITQKDVNKTIELSKNPHIYNELIDSLAPRIKGYHDVKEAILLSLVMGNTKLIDNELESGGINILLIGDHNTGKSTILKTVEKLGIKDKFQCIDNITPSDESYIMQLLTQDKSVICAANFKDGNHDEYDLIKNSIHFSDEFLDCFDLVYIIIDKPNRDCDEELASYVLDLNETSTVSSTFPSVQIKKYLTIAYLYSLEYPPKLTTESKNILKEFYTNTRNFNGENSDPIITVKYLNTIIHLAEASAKLKFKEYVEKDDAEKAVKLGMAFLKNIGYNMELISSDVDNGYIINDETKMTERDKIHKVTEEIKLLEKPYTNYVPENVIIANMYKQGIMKSKTKEILKNLIEKGVIYEPSNGYYGRVS